MVKYLCEKELILMQETKFTKDVIYARDDLKQIYPYPCHETFDKEKVYLPLDFLIYLK